MADDILVSIHGNKFGLGRTGQPLVNPTGAGTMTVGTTAYALAAAGTAHASSTTETALASYTIPANRLSVGSAIRVNFQGIVTASVGAETLAVVLYIGGLAGTALVSVAAIDAVDNMLFSGECLIQIRTIGSSGTMVAYGRYKTPAAEGTYTMKDDFLASTAIDTTVTQAITLGADWSGASANSCRADIFVVEIL